MKLNKLLATLFGALALTACSKDELALPTSETPSEAPTKVAHIDLSVDVNTPELRALYGVESNGSAYRLRMPEKDLNVRLVFAQNSATPGAPALMTTETVVFKKTAGMNRAYYAGPVTLPAGGTGRYRIAAIVLSEVGGKEFARVSSSDEFKVEVLSSDTFVKPTGDGANKVVEVNAPYTAPWRNLPVFDDNKDRFAGSSSLNFNVQGTLLRLRVKNTFATAKTIDKIQVRTNAFDYAVTADLKNTTNNVINFTNSNDGLQAGTPLRLKLSEPVTIEAGQTSDWQYIWVMPTADSQPRIEFTPMDQNTEYLSLHLEKRLPSGSIGVTVPIGKGGYPSAFSDFANHSTELQDEQVILPPLAAFAEYNLAQDGTSFATSHANNASGYFSWADTRGKDGIKIDGKYYWMPTSSQLGMAFPRNTNATSFTTAKTSGVVTENISVHDRTVLNYKASYKSLGNGTIYGLRFQGIPGGAVAQQDNRYRSAYRYKIVGNRVNQDVNVYLEVKARYIGESTTISTALSEIEKDAYWNDPTGIYVTRRFPFAGYNPNGTSATGATHVGLSTLFWVVDLNTGQYGGGYLDGDSDYPGLTLSIHNKVPLTTGLSVRLLKSQSDVTAD